MPDVRHAAVAGMFYPGNPRDLDAEVRRYLADAPAPAADETPPKAVIAPHAGYVYSGAIAATAFARWKPVAERIRRVVVIGPCHRVPVRGLAVSGADSFETPLGRIPVDAAAREAILSLPQVQVFDDTHAEEHSLEVQLPFLQELLTDFTILPIVAGQASGDEVAEVMEKLWGGDETVFVISSDLSHYLDYDSARAIDTETCRAIEALDPSAIGHEQACGRVPVSGILTMARRRGLAVTTLDLRNSGDTAGGPPPRRRLRRLDVHGARCHWPPSAREAGTGAGRDRVRRRDAGAARPSRRHPAASGGRLHRPWSGDRPPLSVELGDYGAGASRQRRQLRHPDQQRRLRGCIGSPTAHRPLVQDVPANAFAAAFNDGRFKPLSPDERHALTLSLSVLSRPEEMLFVGEDHLLDQLREGADGLIIESCKRRALFLPAVWESIPDKAGVPASAQGQGGAGNRPLGRRLPRLAVCHGVGLVGGPRRSRIALGLAAVPR